MPWELEFTDEFSAWWESLSDSQQRSVAHVARLLEEKGPNLPFPYSSKVLSSRHSGMRELRIQHRTRPYRVLYIFDPRRVALLLLGGDKGGDDRWYTHAIPTADRIYDELLEELKGKGK